MSSSGIKSGIWSRSSRLLGMAAKVARHEMGHGLRKRFIASAEKLAGDELKTRIAQAKVLTENLSQLKGAAMKVGQLLSIDGGELLPEEATAVLSKLQGEAEPVSFDVMHRVLLEDLGEDRIGALQQLQPMAAASASIGQVHRAHIGGAPVAVKIQYPGIAESIDSDIKMLETLADSWLTLTRSRIDVEETFEEMRLLLHHEADYERERRLLEAYRMRLSDDDRFVVPATHPDHCSKRVLTMSWENGVALKDWMAANPAPAERRRFAEAILALYCGEFFEWGLVQTDPNHGNFLMRSDGRIVLLDFGATLEYDAQFRDEYRHLLRMIATKDAAATVQAGIDFGILDPREPAEPRQLFAEMLFSAMEPFEPHMQPFVFRDPDYAARARDVGTRFTRSLKYSPPPRKLLFLHRKLGGVFQLLRKLDVELDLAPYWLRMVGRREPAPPLSRRGRTTSCSEPACI